MDSITHTVLGMVEGELLAGKKLGKKAMLFGAIANNLPDIDVVFSFFTSPDKGLLIHRGITHSILFAAVFSICAAIFFSRKIKSLDFNGWLMIWGCGLFSHILLDSFTNYGTGWFEPFSHARVSFNTIFVADPFYTIWFLIAAIALLISRSTNPHRMKWVMVAIIPSMSYLLFTFWNKQSVNNIAEKNFTEQNIPVKKIFTTPTPLNNFLWYIIAEDENGFYTGYHSVFDQSDKISFSYLPAQHSLADTLKNNSSLQRLIQFSDGYYTLTTDSAGNILFNDLRFGFSDFKQPENNVLFSYCLSKQGEVFSLQKGRMKAINAKSFHQLIERVKGI